jgi:hypothetical protein
MALENILIIVGAFIISALPLYMAVKMLGGRATILKTILVNILCSVIIGVIYLVLPFASIIAFIALLWIYHEMFRLKWFKAFLAWIISIVITFLFILIFAILFGISIFL